MTLYLVEHFLSPRLRLEGLSQMSIDRYVIKNIRQRGKRNKDRVIKQLTPMTINHLSVTKCYKVNALTPID